MSGFFDRDLLDQIKAASDIVSVISENVSLRKKGKTYWGCCPFHNEKTPSFHVNPEKEFFYCFGCRAGGNVFSYVQQYYRMSFPEAVRFLAERAHITLPEQQTDETYKRQEERKKAIHEVLSLAATFYHNALTKTQMGKEAFSYILHRGLSQETIVKFQLGYAPNQWRQLTTALIKRGYDEDILVEAGLARKDQQGRTYDYFRNRIMFPITDGRGRVVAFGGRVMDDAEPKYLNSSESSFFSKRKLLFAFDKAYETVRQTKQVILVEGYMDVISCHNRGITNVVASLGTAFTKEQCQLLMRQADEIILAYDMDKAGRLAAHRALEITTDVEVKTRILTLPSGKDPDEYIKQEGKDAFLERVKEAEEPFTFLLNEALQKENVSHASGKSKVLEAVFPYIAMVRQSVERESLLKALALPLWMDNRTIFQLFHEYIKKHSITVVNEDKIPAPMEKNALLSTNETLMMAQALQEVECLQELFSYIGEEDYSLPVHYEVMKKALAVVQEMGKLDTILLEERLTEEEHQVWMALQALDAPKDKQAFYYNLNKCKLASLHKQYKEHSFLADSMQRAGDPKYREELAYAQELQRAIVEWSKS